MTERVFTNADLDRLKERLADRNREGRSPTWDIHALIHRLECAERLVDVLGSELLVDEISGAYTDWRKSAGRE